MATLFNERLVRNEEALARIDLIVSRLIKYIDELIAPAVTVCLLKDNTNYVPIKDEDQLFQMKLHHLQKERRKVEECKPDQHTIDYLCRIKKVIEEKRSRFDLLGSWAEVTRYELWRKKFPKEVYNYKTYFELRLPPLRDPHYKGEKGVRHPKQKPKNKQFQFQAEGFAEYDTAIRLFAKCITGLRFLQKDPIFSKYRPD